ncbi:hypothetical protein ACFX43_07545 [Nocardioides sp. YIM B13467]
MSSRRTSARSGTSADRCSRCRGASG